MAKRFGAQLVILAILAAAPASSLAGIYQDLYRAISDNNLTKLKSLLVPGAKVDTGDEDGGTALMIAALYGRLEFAKLLIDHGADINAKNKRGKTPLIMSVCGNNEANVVKFYIDHGADVNARDQDGETALTIAATRNNTDAAQYLIAHGAVLNVKGQYGRTILMEAASKGHVEVMKLLLKSGADVNGVDGYGNTARDLACQEWADNSNPCPKDEILDTLTNARKPSATEGLDQGLISGAENGDLDKVKSLLNQGANVNAKDNRGWTALIGAAVKGHTDIVKTLIRHGANVNEKENHKGTALMAASYAGNTEVVKLLLEHGAIVNGKAIDGTTPLMVTTSSAVAKVLLDHGADVNAKDMWDSTPIMLAANADIARLLIKHGANLKFRTSGGWTTLMSAVERAPIDVIRVIIANGVDVNAKSSGSDGQTALIRAYAHPDVVQLLIDHGAKVNAKDKNGYTALMRAAGDKDSIESVKILLNHGADVNAREVGGHTALLLGAYYDNIVRLLIEHGADVNARENKYGLTALIMNASEGKTDLVNYLIQNGADVNLKDVEGETALMYAAKNGRLETVKSLVDHNAIVDITDAWACMSWSDDAHPCPKDEIISVLTKARNQMRAGAQLPSTLVENAKTFNPSSNNNLLANDRAEIGHMIEQAAATAAKRAVADQAAKIEEQKVAPPAIHSDVDIPAYTNSENPNNFAVVIGVEKYSSLPVADFADRDAESVRAHLIALGYPMRNIFSLSGQQATRAKITQSVNTWLPQRVGENSTVFFYYSGHGAPDPQTGQAYLVPIDGDAEDLESTAYPMKQLYEKLGKLKTHQVIVALDSCFSGVGGRSVLPKGTRPLVSKIDMGIIPEKLVVLTASDKDQISGTLDDQGHGAFTYYLLKGLDGAARDGSGSVTVRSLYDYMVPKVQDAARLHNRDQTPQLLPTNSERAGIVLR